MAKEKQIGSKFNGLFRFNESDHIAGFYAGSAKIKHGKAFILKTLDGEKALGVPNFSTIERLEDDLEEGDFVLLMYKGKITSKASGNEYQDIRARAWKLEDSELEQWDKERCNIAEILDDMPEYEPESAEEAPEEETGISDDDLPF